ncbi:hypothetical protein BDU57DRAFT_274856 [Ampelomyces quisqualis]|uniref:Uncharacterized protein n=1 Tax=Ampelomyces quisqualis TaxID=50730 RepID=A0A6A5QLX5_AMPQU|nr:hypothetical protein BDU57DRAFT_274856 [Ampelomyces quisqualis]
MQDSIHQPEHFQRSACWIDAMSLLRLATAANVRAFHELSHALNTSDSKWANSINYEGLQDEIGRFRVFAGNLGALQKGHSSLDYRLRDSPLLSSNALKFLQELEENIKEAVAIVTEVRLPYELQPKPEEANDDDDDNNSFFDEDEEEDENVGSRTELSMRFSEIQDIIDNLYKLSVRIRTPTIRSRSLKAATYKPKDADSGVDIMSEYAKYDVQHVAEVIKQLSQPYQHQAESDHNYLINRLSSAITLRRRQFKYWKRHRDKLGVSTVQEEQTYTAGPGVDRPELPMRNDTLEALPDIAIHVTDQDEEAPSHKTGKTLLSGTEATQYHQSLDEIVDTKSVTSYAVTVKDIHGKGVDLPPPPRVADGEKDFECPFCYIICPARYGRGRAWRTHLLQDLQPYVCTYPDCDSSEQLFRSRREWQEHEASHRKAWRCPEHPAAVYKSASRLEDHFRREHADSFPESQLPTIVKVGATTTMDLRTQCPVCSASADTEGLGDFHNHIANHLERLATFALPNVNEDDSEGASGAASHGCTESTYPLNMGTLSLPSNSSDHSNAVNDYEGSKGVRKEHIEVDIVDRQPQRATASATLSAESLDQLPDERQNRLKTLFASPLDVRIKPPDNSDSDSVSHRDPSYILPIMEGRSVTKAAGVELVDIPTIRALYRSRRLLQRDQSFAPNDAYNQVISFCYHDITKLKVDAIVNSANKALKGTRRKCLNNDIHRAAGPELAEETKSIGKLKDEAVLTGGYRLPSQHVIHVSRPGSWGTKSTRDFKQLTDCYRNVFKVAVSHELKTIAFPCLGTGGVGFPARVAARITLQEIREYLDEHQEHNFERIVFCVNTPADEKAYIDFLPVYFPPTHGDLDVARSSVWSEDRAAVAIQVLDARNEIQKVLWQLNLSLSLSVPEFPKDLLGHFSAIDQTLGSIRRFLLWSNEVSQNLRDLKLICSVMQLLCGTFTEVISLLKDRGDQGQRNDKLVWDDYVSDMEARHGTDPSGFLIACRNFVESLENAITKNEVAFDHVIGMIDTRPKLERFKVKQRVGRDAEGTQDHLNEVLYIREFQRDTVTQSRDTIKIHHVPSIAQLYKLGELDEKPTYASPSTLFNSQVCLVREDITRIEVDVMVNSTDASFEGIGTLARSVFLRGGEQLREVVKTIGEAKEGDVKLTEGYLLPAKHILHVVPPGQFRQDTKDTMRKMYREVLYTAVNLRATSIAIPCIGTGLLNYPRRDSVSLALEEVKRFLESAVPDSLIKKIIFVVFSSNDEFVYKSLLPVYFPPPDLKSNLTSSKSIPRQDTETPTALGSTKTPKRTIFGSIGEAFRSLRSSKTPDMSRTLNVNEENALIEFESHTLTCKTCVDIKKLYIEGRDLCRGGYGDASKVLQYMEMQADGKVYTKADTKGQSTNLEIPTEMFPLSMELLAAVEKSYRDEHRSRPFVTPNRSYGAITQDQAPSVGAPGSNNDDGETLVNTEPKVARAHVFTKSGFVDEWTAASSDECQIRVHVDKVVISEKGLPEIMPLLSLGLETFTVVERYMTTPEVTLTGTTRLQSSLKSEGDILFRCRSDHECNSLLRSIRRAVEGLQVAAYTKEGHGRTATTAEPGQNTSKEHIEWSEHISDIRSGGLSDLRYKMDRLGAAASGLNEASDIPKLYDASRSPLATRILLCLTADLKTRPGSYIGLKTDRLVSELQTTFPQVRMALEELVAANEIHTTVDDDTWVISHPPNDLPVLSAKQPDTATREVGSIEDQPALSVHFAEGPANEISPLETVKSDPQTTVTAASSSMWHNDGIPLTPIALWITSYHLYDPPNIGDAAWNRDIARRLGTSVYAIENALTEFRQKTRSYGILEQPDNPYLEPGVIVADYSDQSQTTVFISRSLVYPEVLQEEGVDFEEHEDLVVLRRRLAKGELIQWNTRSIEIKRSHDKTSSALRSGLGQHPESKGKGTNLAIAPENAAGKTARKQQDEEKAREGFEASPAAADHSKPTPDDLTSSQQTPSSTDVPQQDLADSIAPGAWRCPYCEYANSESSQVCASCGESQFDLLVDDAEDVDIEPRRETDIALETYEHAMSWLNLTHRESDDSVVTMASIRVADDPTCVETARKAVSLIAEHRDSDRLRRYSGMRVPRTSTPVNDPNPAGASIAGEEETQNEAPSREGLPAVPSLNLVSPTPPGSRPSTPPLP